MEQAIRDQVAASSFAAVCRAVLLVAIVGLWTPTLAQDLCTGDCDESGHVTIDEVVTGVSVALGTASLSQCPAIDCNAEGQVTVDCIVWAVNNTLDGCGGPTPTPTPDILALATQIPEAPHDRVVSADGRVELLIPDGALPVGVDLSEIEIAPIDPSATGVAIDGGDPLLAYELSPDGLEFSGPTLLRITADAAADGSVPGLFLVSDDELVPIDPKLVDIDLGDETVTLTVALFHFSIVIVHGDPFAGLNPFLVSLLVPGDVFTVGETFTSIASVDRVADVTGFVFILGLAYFVDFEGEASLVGSWHGSSQLSPRTRQDAPSRTVLAEGATINSTQDFTCDVAGPATVRYEAFLDYFRAFDTVLSPRFSVRNLDIVRVTSEPFECREPSPTPTPTPIRIGRLDGHLTTDRGCIETGSEAVISPGERITIRFEVESDDFAEADVTIFDRLANGIEDVFFQGTIPTNEPMFRSGTVTLPLGLERLRLVATNGEAMSTDQCTFEVREEAAACGGILGMTCSGPTFCEYPPGTCGSSDVLGTCILIPSVCLPVFDPVCGCDETTYDNDCLRQQAGVAKTFDGACEAEK